MCCVKVNDLIAFTEKYEFRVAIFPSSSQSIFSLQHDSEIFTNHNINNYNQRLGVIVFFLLFIHFWAGACASKNPHSKKIFLTVNHLAPSGYFP